MAKRGKGIYKRCDGRYEGRFIKGRDMNGKAIYGCVTAQTYAEVKEKLNKAKLALESNKTAVSTETLCGMLTAHIEGIRSQVKLSTCNLYERYIEKYISPYFGNTRCDRLTNEIMQVFVNKKIEDGLSARTVKAIFSFIKAGLTSVPIDVLRVKFPKYATKDVEVFSLSEQKRLEEAVKVADDVDRIGVMLCLYTGIRIGELTGLVWSDVLFEREEIVIQRTLQRVKADSASGAKTVVSTFDPKSKASIRSIPLQKFILDMLSEHKKTSVGEYVLSGSDKPVEPRVYQRRFNKLLKSAGIREVNFHTLRHNFAVRALEKGIDYKTISELLGHSSATVTMKTYAHSLDEHKRNSMEALAHLYE